MTDVQHVQDVQVIEGDEQRSFEDRVQAFMDREIRVLDDRFRNAREVAEVQVVYGAGSIEAFAKEVGIARPTAYNYRGVWEMFGDDWLNGTLDQNQYWTHYVTTVRRLRAEDQRQSIEDSSSEGRSEAEHDLATQGADAPKNVETVDMLACPKCGEVYPLREAEVRTEAVA